MISVFLFCFLIFFIFSLKKNSKEIKNVYKILKINIAYLEAKLNYKKMSLLSVGFDPTSNNSRWILNATKEGRIGCLFIFIYFFLLFYRTFLCALYLNHLLNLQFNLKQSWYNCHCWAVLLPKFHSLCLSIFI